MLVKGRKVQNKMCECIAWQHLTNSFANPAIMRQTCRTLRSTFHIRTLSRHQIGSWNEGSQTRWRERKSEGENEQFIFPVRLSKIRRRSFWSQEECPYRFNAMKIAYKTITKDSVRDLCSWDSTALIEDHSKCACQASLTNPIEGGEDSCFLSFSLQGEEQSYEIIRTW